MGGKWSIAILLILSLAWQVQSDVECTANGRYSDPYDTTCKNYTLCVALSDGTFLSYNYVCPSTSLFNPTTGICTTSYVCNVTDTITSDSTCTADGFFADSTSTNCSSYIQCVSINGTYDGTTLTCPTETYYNPNTTLCDADYICVTTFTCTAAGRYANPSDTTCQTYYLCVELSDGTLAEYEYTCPSTSMFNPTSKICTTSYTCPVTTTCDSDDSCDDTDSTTNNTIAFTCTAEGYFEDSSSTNCSSYIQCVSINGTYFGRTLTCPTETYYNPNTTLCDARYNCVTTFTCTAAGRYANPSDTTCQTYYLCVKLSDGTLAEYEYTCPSTSTFNPTSKICTTSYTCPVTTTCDSDDSCDDTDSTTNNTIAFECTTEGYFDDSSSMNCSSYIECIYINETFIETTYTCPSDTYYNPNTTLCDASYNCTSSYTCTSEGRFANPEDSTCQTYYLCVEFSNGTFLKDVYTCPLSSVFSPTLKMCTTSYTCPISTKCSSSSDCDDIDTTTPNPTPFTCTTEGYFADLSSENCASFIECVSINGTYVNTTLTCPTDTYYNPNTTLCDASYNCTSSFTCTAAGRFANSADTTCQTYYLCVEFSNGTLEKYEYTCPSTSMFSPISKNCTSSYNCPTITSCSSDYACDTTNTTASNSTDSICTADGYFIDSTSMNCSSYIECVNINGTFVETTFTCPTDTYYNPNTTLCEASFNCSSIFTCSGAGRFANPVDTTCQTYYLCIELSNGTLVEYEYSCPSTSMFSTTSKMCTTSYTCPIPTTCTSTDTCDTANTTISNTTTLTCTSDGYFVDSSSENCSSYIECVNIDGTYIETTLTCPPDTYYNPNTTLCDTSYACPFTCTAAGRYANSADTTCQSYYLCITASNGTILEYKHTCPLISVFDPTAKICTTTSYTCPTS